MSSMIRSSRAVFSYTTVLEVLCVFMQATMTICLMMGIIHDIRREDMSVATTARWSALTINLCQVILCLMALMVVTNTHLWNLQHCRRVLHLQTVNTLLLPTAWCMAIMGGSALLWLIGMACLQTIRYATLYWHWQGLLRLRVFMPIIPVREEISNGVYRTARLQ